MWSERGLDLSQYYVVTGCGLDEEEYRVFTDQLFEELEQRGWPTRYECPFHIGVTIGVHTGPRPSGWRSFAGRPVPRSRKKNKKCGAGNLLVRRPRLL